jgi:excisionase family DNA binding protein
MTDVTANPTEAETSDPTTEGDNLPVTELPPRLAYGVEETAALISISRRMLYELLRSGRLASVKIGNRRLIRRTDLERFLDELEAGT